MHHRPEQQAESSPRATPGGAPGKARALAGPRAELGPVLIVDPCASERERMSDILRDAGYRVLGTAAPGAGLALAREQQPALILIDQCEPAMDGLELLGQLSRDPSTCEIPVILLAARPHTPTKVRGFWRGARDYLAKPVPARELLENLLTHVEKPRTGATGALV